MVEREVPCYQPGSLNHVDPYFVLEHVVLLLVLTHSVIGRTSSSYWKGYYMKEDHRSYLTQLLQLRKEIRKKFRLVRDSYPCPLQYRCSVLPIERFNDLLPVGLLAQLVARALNRYRRGQGFKSRTSLSIFRLSFRNCKGCVYKCDDLLSYNSSPPSSHTYDFHMFITWKVIVVYELQPKVFGQLAFLCLRLPNRGNSKYADLRTFTAQSSFYILRFLFQKQVENLHDLLKITKFSDIFSPSENSTFYLKRLS